ncbi:MAG: hypothetical protein RLY49_85 [Candidatus Parcubacteria bacterium]|jgi:predicted ATP-dependent endonuclease of OLD family
MKPIYLDLHIHTSDDPNNLNNNYDLDTLINKIREKVGSDDFLISLTDHNTVNEKAYLDALKKIEKNLILGVELHIQTDLGQASKAYHCHIYFNFDSNKITEDVIKDINSKLDFLYPNKTPELKDGSIPTIQGIIEMFDNYDFILLPHGGQNHATFNSAMPEGKNLDNVMQRSIYYNFLDGFTSRSNNGTEKTIEYLKKLGVSEFVNLITCSDNYNPSNYPNSKSQNASEFIPTWMYAEPTFSGLRLSLTDSSRLEYNVEKPKSWRESIKSISLNNDFLDIDVSLTPGLNVIIGESSSGKTLLVDSLRRLLEKVSFKDSDYVKYGVESMKVDFPDETVPYYIGQNFISKVTGDNNINEIEIIRKIFPQNHDATKLVDIHLKKLKNNLEVLFDTVECLENLEGEIKRIRILSKLITLESVNKNIFKYLLNTTSSVENIDYSDVDAREDIGFLDQLNKRLTKNPFINHDESLIIKLKEEIEKIRELSILEDGVRNIIQNNKSNMDRVLRERQGQSAENKQDFETLLSLMKKYVCQLNIFYKTLSLITKQTISEESKALVINQNQLIIENKLKLDKEILKDEFNNGLLVEKSISDIDTISPSALYRNNFKRNLKGIPSGSSATYRAIKDFIYSKFIEKNIVKYKIITPDGKDFENLSPGHKASVILELILNFDGDTAPLIIDQPEDNLATSYINKGLVKSIKNMKKKKQIIFVSHNATIPMSADAQNLILCENNGEKIVIKSSSLEGSINRKSSLDHIAIITDGGKSSVKKRFKKYNLKEFNN